MANTTPPRMVPRAEKLPTVPPLPPAYRAVIVYTRDGRTHRPVRKVWPTKAEALAYAEKWIAANTRGEG